MRARKYFLIGRAVLTIAVVAWVGRRVNWPALRGTLRQVEIGKLAAAISLQGGSVALAATRWRLLLANERIRPGWLAIARLTLTGLFFNLFFLGSAGGDASRFVGALAHAGERKIRLGLSLLQDRLIGLGAQLLVITALVAVQCRNLPPGRPLRFLALGTPVACGVFFALVAVCWVRNSHAAKSGQPRGWLSAGLALARASFPRPVFLSTLALSVANHVLVIASGCLAIRAVGLALPLLTASVVIGFTFLALTLPLTLAGLGVRDGMLVWLLGILSQVPRDAAIGLSTCMLGITLFWGVAGGVAFYWPTATRRQSG